MKLTYQQRALAKARAELYDVKPAVRAVPAAPDLPPKPVLRPPPKQPHRTHKG